MRRTLPQHAPAASKPDKLVVSRNRYWVLAAIALGTTLAPLNSTMIAVALPRIQADLDVSVTQTSWLVTLYLAAMAVGQPIGGRLGDVYGRRRIYLGGLVWFGIVSVGCAFAPNLAVLIFFRTQQALAGALTFPNGAAIVREAIPAEQRGSAFGVIGMTTGLAAAIGPPLGGVLVHSFGWEAIFWANAPVVAGSLFLNARFLPRTHAANPARVPFDTIGTLLFAFTLSAIIAIPALLKAGGAMLAAGAAVAAAIAGVLFVRWELRVTGPVVPVRLFQTRPFAMACLSICLSNLVMYTTLLALPQFLDDVRGENERVIGGSLAALSAFAAMWGLAGGRISDARGKWLPAVFGAVVLGAGAVGIAAVLDTNPLWPLVVLLAVMGLGLGIQSAPVQTAAIEAAPAASTGSAAGIFSTSRYIGSVTGATALALIFANDAQTTNVQTYQWLFAGLALIAAAGIVVNAHVAERR